MTLEIKGLFVDSDGDLQLWVDTGNTPSLPNSFVLHVGSESTDARQRHAAVVLHAVQHHEPGVYL